MFGIEHMRFLSDRQSSAGAARLDAHRSGYWQPEIVRRINKAITQPITRDVVATARSATSRFSLLVIGGDTKSRFVVPASRGGEMELLGLLLCSAAIMILTLYGAWMLGGIWLVLVTVLLPLALLAHQLAQARAG